MTRFPARTLTAVVVLAVAVSANVLIGVLGVQGGFRDRLERAAATLPGDRVVVSRPTALKQLFPPETVEALQHVLDSAVVSGRSDTRGTPLAISYKPDQSREVLNSPLRFVAVTPDYFETVGYRLASGRVPTLDEYDRGERVAVIGAWLAAERGLKIGDVVTQPPYLPTEYRVIGILRATGDLKETKTFGDTPSGTDATFFVPYNARPTIIGLNPMTQKWGPQEVVEGVEIIVSPRGSNLSDLLSTLRAFLGERYPDGSFTIATMSAGRIVYERVSKNTAKFFLIAVLATVFLAAVNVANLLLMDVMRQARAIGIRRAVGASSRQIAWSAGTRSVRIFLLGGAIGAGFVFWTRPSLEKLLGNDLVVSWRPLLLGAAALLGAGLAAALLPASLIADWLPADAIEGRTPGTVVRKRFDLKKSVAGLTVAIGIAALAVVQTGGSGTQLDVRKVLRSFAGDTVLVSDPDPFDLGEAEPYNLTPGDAADLAQALGSGVNVAWERTSNLVLLGDAGEVYAALVEIAGSYPIVRPYGLAAGSWEGVLAGRGVAVGSVIAKTLASSAEEAVGKAVRIGDRQALVVAVLKPRPDDTADLGFDRDYAVFATPGLYATPWQEYKASAWVAPAVERPGQIEQVRQAVQDWAQLRFAGRVLPRIEAPVDRLGELSGAIESLTGILRFFGLLALLIAVFGVTTVMFVRVVERTREIGIRRTLGATRRAIAGLIVAESVRLTVLAATAGVVVAVAITLVMAVARGWPALLAAEALVVGGALAVVTGVAAALLPALSATAIPPTQAIRTE